MSETGQGGGGGVEGGALNVTAREVLQSEFAEQSFARLDRIWRACDLPAMDSLPIVTAVSLALDLSMAVEAWGEQAEGGSEVDGALQRIAADLIEKAARAKRESA